MSDWCTCTIQASVSRLYSSDLVIERTPMRLNVLRSFDHAYMYHRARKRKYDYHPFSTHFIRHSWIREEMPLKKVTKSMDKAKWRTVERRPLEEEAQDLPQQSSPVADPPEPANKCVSLQSLIGIRILRMNLANKSCNDSKALTRTKDSLNHSSWPQNTGIERCNSA